MPGRRRIKVLRRLKILEASLCNAAANPHCHVTLWKRHDPASEDFDDYNDHHEDEHEEPEMPEPTYGRDDVAEAMLAHASAMHPELTREAALAKAVRDGDPLVHGLYKRHAELPPEFAKAEGEAAGISQTEAMDAAWADIEAAADEMWDRFPSLTREQVLAKTMERHPGLVDTYNRAQSEAQFALDRRYGHRRVL
jgi:hypothetical protein